ncbi:hypothetical protein SB775_31415, partial [Peribacillus sp. SIMBA_075]
FSQETQAILFHHDWPGNVRELANVVEYAVNMEVCTSIQPASLPGALVKNNSDSLRSSWTVGSEEQQNDLLSLKEMERMAITEAL